MQLQLVRDFDIRRIMFLKNAINVLMVTFWVVSQTVMSFAHSPFAVAEPKAITTSATAGHAHSVSGSAAHTDHSVTHEQSGNTSEHDHSSALQDCGGVQCSAFGASNVFGLGTDLRSREFGHKPILALLPVNLGLATPPPNTIV